MARRAGRYVDAGRCRSRSPGRWPYVVVHAFGADGKELYNSLKDQRWLLNR